MTLSIAILEPNAADLERARQAAPGARLIALTSRPLAAAADITVVQLDARDRRPWGAIAVEHAEPGMALFAYPGESVRIAGAVPAVPSDVPVVLRRSQPGAVALPAPFAPTLGPVRAEVQPRLVRVDGTNRWDPDGLSSSAEATTDAITILEGAPRWSPPGAFVDLLIAAEGPSAALALGLAVSTCYAQRDDLEESARRLELLGRGGHGSSIAWLDHGLAIASAELRRGNTSGAVEALTSSSNEPEACLLLGAIDAWSGRFEDAERRLFDALRAPHPARPLLIAQLSAWAGWFLADLDWQEGRYGEARDWLYRVREDLPELAGRRLELLDVIPTRASKARDNRRPATTEEFLSAGDYVGAVERAAITVDGADPDFLQRGSALLGLRHYREAQGDAWTQLALEPSDVNAALLLGECALALGEWDEALAALNFADALDVDGRAAARLAGEYLRRDDLLQAEIWSRRAIAVDRAKGSARLTLARVLLRHADGQGAYELLAPLVEEQPDDAEARYELTRLLVDAGEADLAIAVAQPGVDPDRPAPADAPLMLLLADALHLAGRLTEERIVRELAFRLAPSLQTTAEAASSAA